MTDKRLQEIKDSVELQLELAKYLKVDYEMILEEKELLDEIDRLKKEIKNLTNKK